MSTSPPPRPPRSPWPRLLVLLCCCLTAFFSASSCSEKEPELTPKDDNEPGLRIPLPDGKSDQYGLLPEEVGGFKVTRGAAAGYVPDKACNECHAEIYKSYQEMGMARSFYPPTKDNVIEDLGKPYYHEASKRYYVMTRRDGKLYQKRYCKDAEGKPFAEFESEVTWIMGSGNHVRTYLSQTDHGEMYELPLSWYPKTGWRMSPGYDQLNHHGFERMIDRACMFCHNAFPEVPVGSDLQHMPLLFPKDLPHGIGCQRCHGPGARHVELAQDANAPAEELRKRILNPGRFPDGKKDEVCMSCHLQPESLRGGLLPRNMRVGDYSYRPNTDLKKYLFYLDHGSEKEQRERFEVNHHAYRMRWSKCFTGSDGKMTCITCHNPHKKVAKEEQVAFYRNKCMQCHKLTDCQMEGMGTTTAPGEADCVSCHMVKARPTDVVHVTVTDHFIRRHPPEKDLTAPLAEVRVDRVPTSITPYFRDYLNDPLWEVHEGFGTCFAPTPDSVAKWLRAFEQTKPHTAATYIRVARVLMESPDSRKAVGLLQDGLGKFPEVVEMHAALGDTFFTVGEMDKSLQHLLKAHSMRPDDPAINKSLGSAYAELGNWDKAKKAYEEALDLRPINWTTWRQLGYVLTQMEDMDGALFAFQKAIALNPDDFKAYQNSALILEQKGRWKESLQLLEQGATRHLEVKLDLIVSYILAPKGSQDLAKAVAHAEEVVRDNPDSGRCMLYKALALLHAGKPTDAAQLVGPAHKKGADPACCSAIASLAALRLGQEKEANALLEDFGRRLQTPSDERLRPTLVSIIRSLMKPPDQGGKGNGK